MSSVNVRRTFSRGNVLYSGYLLKEIKTFFGSRTERKQRFFILPRVRTTDVNIKLRLSYYMAPGDAVESGCYFLTPKSYIRDISDAESMSYPSSPSASGSIVSHLGPSTNSSKDSKAILTYGFRLHPSHDSPSVSLWTTSWEERELWKTAITEGINLLSQKERVLRRDMRKRRKEINHKKRSSNQGAGRSRSVSHNPDISNSPAVRNLVSFGKEILGLEPMSGTSCDGSEEEQGSPAMRKSLRMRSKSYDDTASAHTSPLQRSSESTNTSNDPLFSENIQDIKKRHNSNLDSNVSDTDFRDDFFRMDGFRKPSSQHGELRQRRMKSSKRLSEDLKISQRESKGSQSSKADHSSKHKNGKRSNSYIVDTQKRTGVHDIAQPATSLSEDWRSMDKKPQSVSSLAAEFKSSILTRFSTESRGSSVGFDLNDPADSICLTYLRTLQPVATEHQNISQVLHPLMEKLILKLRNRSRRSSILQKISPIDSPKRRQYVSDVTVISAKESRLLHEFEQAYYSSTMMIRSHRQNVMLSLRPKLRRFVMELERVIAMADGIGETSSTNLENDHSSSSEASADMINIKLSSVERDENNTENSQHAGVDQKSPASKVLESGGCPSGMLHLEVLRGSKLYNTQRLSRQDPYVLVRVAGMRKPQRTKHDRSGGTEPEWTAESHNNTFALPIQGSQDIKSYPERLFLEVWNNNTLADSLIGRADIDIMPFVRKAGRTAVHWLPITDADGYGDHGKILIRIRFENLAADRILTSDGMTEQIGSLHIGFPQAKLHLLILPQGKMNRVLSSSLSSSSSATTMTTNSLATQAKHSDLGTSSGPVMTNELSNRNSIEQIIKHKEPIETYTETVYAIRVLVEDHELLTEHISVGDMEADGTLSFRSWALNRDGRQKLKLPLAITDPFAKIQFVLFSMMPDNDEEQIIGTAETSLLHLVEQQATASMEHEKLEEMKWKRIDTAQNQQFYFPTSIENNKMFIGEEAQMRGSYTVFQKSFKKQLAIARGKGKASLRTASALLRGPVIAETNSKGHTSAQHVRTTPVMIPPCVLKLKAGRKENKEVGVLQLQLHYKERPSSIFIPRPVKYEDHDFSFRRFERNVSRSIRMVRSIRSLFAVTSYILNWEEPKLSTAILCLFIWTSLFAFDRQIAILPIVLVFILLRQHKHRKSGRFRHSFVLRGLTGKISAAIGSSGSTSLDTRAQGFRRSSEASKKVDQATIAISGMPTELRVAVIAAKNLSARGENLKHKIINRSPSIASNGSSDRCTAEVFKPNAFAEVYFVAVTRKSFRRRQRRKSMKKRAATINSSRSSAFSESSNGLRSSKNYSSSSISRDDSIWNPAGDFGYQHRSSTEGAGLTSVRFVESSSLIGRTNTEYDSDSPRWGFNEKSLGSSRLHIPGERTVVERWHDHATAFKTLLPQTSGRDLFGIGIGSRRRSKITESKFKEHNLNKSPNAVAEAMVSVDGSASSGKFKWDSSEKLEKDSEKEILASDDTVNSLFSSFSGESVIVVRIYHESSESLSSGGLSLEEHNDCECLGQAVVPLSELVGIDRGVNGGDQPVYEKWVPLYINSMTPASTQFEESRGEHNRSHYIQGAGKTHDKNDEVPRVLVRLQLALPLPTWHTRRQLQRRHAERKADKERRRAIRMEKRQQRAQASRMRKGPQGFGGYNTPSNSVKRTAELSATPQRHKLDSITEVASDQVAVVAGEPKLDTSAISGRSSPRGSSYERNLDFHDDLASIKRTAANVDNAKSEKNEGGYSLGTGYYGRFLKIRSSTRYVQNGLDNIARTFERIKNLLTWAHPTKTHAFLVVMLVMSLIFLMIPSRYIVLVVGVYLFTEKFRRQGTIVARTWHFLNTIPSDEQLDNLFEDERSRFQERLQRGLDLKKTKRRPSKRDSHGLDLVSKPSTDLDIKGAKVDLHANWEGYMQTYGRSRIGKTIKKRNTRYFALQSHGVLQWWLRRELAESGQKPRGELFLRPSDASSETVNAGGSMVLPIDRNNAWEIEVRGFRDRQLTERLVIVLIARSSNDREGWLHALQQVIEHLEIQSEMKTVAAIQGQSNKVAVK